MQRKTKAAKKIIKESNAITWRRIWKNLGSWHKKGIVGDDPRVLEFPEFAVRKLSTYLGKVLRFR